VTFNCCNKSFPNPSESVPSKSRPVIKLLEAIPTVVLTNSASIAAACLSFTSTPTSKSLMNPRPRTLQLSEFRIKHFSSPTSSPAVTSVIVITTAVGPTLRLLAANLPS
jgi:hypothetical protein